MPKLSIVVPVYNTEKYLHQCIDSILAQTFDDYELILVDDGSTDQSGHICDTYAKDNPKVAVIHTENHGVVTARRTGVNYAKGEYIGFVDSDDWLDLDFYRDIFEKADNINADIIICSNVHRAIGSQKTTLYRSGYYDIKELESTIFQNMIYNTLKEQFYCSPLLWDKIFRTELLKKVYIGIDPCITLGEDAVCTYPSLAQANSILIVDNCACYNYREDHVSMVNQCDIRLLQRVYALAVNMNQQFSELPKNFDNQVQCFIAYNGLYAVRQVLLLNREQRLYKRIHTVKRFLAQPVMAHAFREAQKSDCSNKLKWKLYLATNNHPFLLWLMLQCNDVYQKMKSANK